MKTAALFALATWAAASAAQDIDPSHSLIERGRYLAAAGDCAACHTADGGQAYAGGRPIPTPFGTIYSTNITPDPDTGIGRWSADDFYRALHQGRRPNGEHLYPAFPYPWFTRLSRQDVDALRAYLEALPPVRQENRAAALPFPLSVREAVAVWNAMFFAEGEYRPDASQSAQWNRGRYLVEGPGHCGACHSAKNVLGGVKRSAHLEGGYGENWYAPALTNDAREGLGSWSVQEIVEFLKTGSNARSAAGGPMGEVVRHSTQHLSEADLEAMAAYLKSLPGNAGRQTAAAGDAQRLERGRAVYVDQCAGCHMANGEGQPGVFPPLKGNAVVQAHDPETLLHTILEGARTVATRAKPTGLAMPAFDWKLSDEDVADLASWLRSTWGNQAGAVAASTVRETRERLRPSAG